MVLPQMGIQHVVPALQTDLNQVYVAGSNGRLCVPTQQGIEQASTEPEVFRRLYQANLHCSTHTLADDTGAKALFAADEGQSWIRSISLSEPMTSVIASFRHASGRYWHIEIPLPREGVPAYQSMKIGVQKAGINAAVRNYIRSEESGFPYFDIYMDFCFSGSSLAALASEALSLTPVTPLPQLAIQLASAFYMSDGYFLPTAENRLRILATYEHQERPQSITLSQGEGGLVPVHPIMTAGLRRLNLGSISEESCHFNIQGNLETGSLEVYCHQWASEGTGGLRQQPMPALLWDFIAAQTGISLEQPLSKAT